MCAQLALKNHSIGRAIFFESIKNGTQLEDVVQLGAAIAGYAWLFV
jgi:hypothetical protein